MDWLRPHICRPIGCLTNLVPTFFIIRINLNLFALEYSKHCVFELIFCNSLYYNNKHRFALVGHLQILIVKACRLFLPSLLAWQDTELNIGIIDLSVNRCDCVCGGSIPCMLPLSYELMELTINGTHQLW